jgi:hypothetical protein
VELVPAIRAAIRVFKPLLDTMITENMTAFWQSERDLLDPFWSLDAILVVTNDTTSVCIGQFFQFDNLE